METENTHATEHPPGIQALFRAIDLFGGSQARLARAMGSKSTQLVNNWIRRGRVSAEWCPNIERATNHAVLCEELRDDVEWLVPTKRPKKTAKQ
jgi:DNA-binding transcriptional regulator YdaS (Cro superfamily)